MKGRVPLFPWKPPMAVSFCQHERTRLWVSNFVIQPPILEFWDYSVWLSEFDNTGSCSLLFTCSDELVRTFCMVSVMKRISCILHLERLQWLFVVFPFPSLLPVRLISHTTREDNIGLAPGQPSVWYKLYYFTCNQ